MIDQKSNHLLYKLTKMAKDYLITLILVQINLQFLESRNRIKSKINIKSGEIKNKPYNAEDVQNDYEFKKAMSKTNYILDDFPKLK